MDFMERKVITPSTSSGSPRETLEVLQKRLRATEHETQGLVEELGKYGFHKDSSTAGAETARAGRIEPIAPFRTGIAENEAMRKDYEQLVVRVCRAESTIQSLKLGLVSLQAEKSLGSQEETEKFALAREAYEKEVKKLTRELTRCKQALSSCEEDRQRAEDGMQRLTNTLEAVATENTGVTAQLEEFRQEKHNIHKKMAEVWKN